MLYACRGQEKSRMIVIRWEEGRVMYFVKEGILEGINEVFQEKVEIEEFLEMLYFLLK